MLLDPVQAVASDRPEAPGERGRRAPSARVARRRAQVLEYLTDPIVVAETPELLAEQAHDLYRAFKPRNGWQDWLTSEIAVIMVRINRCTRVERRLRDHASYRAIDFWEDDRALEVEEIGARLGRDPAGVVARLRGCPAGIDWLARRWRGLARVEARDWTADQRTLAARLAGGDDAIDPTAPGFIEGQLLDLEARRERAEEADNVLRGLVEADLSDEIPGLVRLRRYARSLHRQMKWYVDQFHVEHPDRWDDPMRQPASVSRELITEEMSRRPRWSFRERDPHADARPAADAGSGAANDETNPTAPASGAASDATNPTAPGSAAANDAANPTPAAGWGPSLAAAARRAGAGAVPVVHDYANERIRPVDRPRRANPVLEATRRERASRRRRALAAATSS